MFSSDRGQTEPLAALVAVFTLGLGLSLYVGVLDSMLPLLTIESEMAPVATNRFIQEASDFGVVRPPIGDAIDAASPNGYFMNATVRTRTDAWFGGPTRGEISDCVRRRVSVRTAPGRVRPGTLEVCVWPEA
ncbi:MAG: hypothetical protein ACI9TI_000336 [Natronomonas sp.]|uniref:DUF7285 family protein n=1 Tax=Natronomonas sp. TaxID=2184060 RepID=UPI0039890EF0